MAWLRRVNEDNADLNRNFLPPGEPYEGEPENYAKLDHLLNPKKMQTGREYYTIRAAWHSLKLGFANAKQAVQEGQYTRPKSLQYGGGKLAESSQNFIAWCERNLSNVQKLFGLIFIQDWGPSVSILCLLEKGPTRLELKQRYGPGYNHWIQRKELHTKFEGGYKRESKHVFRKELDQYHSRIWNHQTNSTLAFGSGRESLDTMEWKTTP